MIDHGAVAQLGERLVCNQEATGSIPVSSTNSNLILGVRSSGIEYWVGMEAVGRMLVGFRKDSYSLRRVRGLSS